MLDQVQRIRDTVGRVAPGPLLVRAGTFLTALGALLTASPVVVVTSRYLAGLVLLAALPMLWPRARAATFVALVTVCGWLVATMGFGERITLVRLFGITGLLYLMHSLTALAAVLPHDAVTAPDVLSRWIGRALLVVAASAVPALAVVVIADAVRGAYLLASLAGLVVAVTIAGLLAYLQRRR
jgi:hypothetical protein